MEAKVPSSVFRFSKSGVEVVQLVFHKVPDDSKVQLRIRIPFLEHYLLCMFSWLFKLREHAFLQNEWKDHFTTPGAVKSVV